MSRLDDLAAFYGLLDRVERRAGGKRNLSECNGRMGWPKRGIYFFFENGEERTHSGRGPRVVRVGTHALTRTSNTSLWQRLAQHRGIANGMGGNHRGSIFRLLLGNALRARHASTSPESWGVGGDPGVAALRLRVSRETVLEKEAELEWEVSKRIGAMPFLWLEINDEPGPDSLRAYIERNAIALLSNYGKAPLDPASEAWLGRYCDRDRVRQSGLWNNNHVDEAYAPDFIGLIDGLVEAAMGSPKTGECNDLPRRGA